MEMFEYMECVCTEENELSISELNKHGHDGWKLISVYTTLQHGNTTRIVYIFIKKI